ncbi:MAG: S9 family peptidase [Vicinamibacterales bacterium]
MRRRSLTAALVLLIAAGGRPAAEPGLVQPGAAGRVPTIDDILSLQRVGAPAMSPDGSAVAYTLRETNWEQDAFETEIWLVRADGTGAKALTNAKGSSSSPAWSPDGTRLAFLSDRGGKMQIFLAALSGGEAQPLTTVETGVSAFAWAPNGTRLAFTAQDPLGAEREARDKKYGEFEIVDLDQRLTHLYLLDVATRVVTRLTEGAFTVGRFGWSPDSSRLVFDHRINPDPANSGTADISIVDVSTRERRALVTQDGPDANPMWSPDGREIVFESAMAQPSYFFTNGRLAVVPATGGTPRALTTTFDENPSLEAWVAGGLYFSASIRTGAYLFRLDPATGAATRLGPADGVAASQFSFSRDGAKVAYIASDATSFPDLFTAEVVASPRLGLARTTKVSETGGQIASWAIGTRELVRWKSVDGAEIEGVLHKPSNFEPGTRHPLLVVIHGGPTGVSRPTPVSAGFAYPVEAWLAKGALILQPNYRGSAGYGEAFRSLNVRNLGIGDAWDVVSGIDHLVSAGLVDGTRVGTMGWSQGGYISAFLTTHDSARFKAASVGAGISDWMTYYVNTDIHPFTRQYLKATPWDDPKIYAVTSPMTYIKQARTPTLIQHGDKDPRVPPPNAFELYQGLQDQGTPVRLVLYKGFGHALTKPKAQRAAMEHNLEWFDTHLFKPAPPTSVDAGRPRP